MGWLGRLLERRSATLTQRDIRLVEALGGEETAAGIRVSPETATGVSAVHAAVQLIAETAASLPLNVYLRADDGSRQVAEDHPLQAVLHDRWNPRLTAFAGREHLIASTLLTGNGYAAIESNSRGAVTALWPLHPERVRVVELASGRLRYEVSGPAGVRRYLQDEVLHLRYRTRDGINGLSPITIARETIGNALAQGRFEGRFFRNGARMSGALKHPGKLSDQAATRLRDSFERLYSGPENVGKTAILEEGMEYTPSACRWSMRNSWSPAG